MYGALVKNTSGQILISSDIDSLHWKGEAYWYDTIRSGLTEFPNYAADDNTASTLSGMTLERYSIVCDTTPMFFIKPTSYTAFSGVVQQFNVGNTWFVDVIQSQAISRVQVFAFAKAQSVNPSYETHGMATYRANGQVAFDSRLKPMAIFDAKTVIPPAIPCDGGQPTESGLYDYAYTDSVLDHNFKSDYSFTSYPIRIDVSYRDLMFSAPSVAQAVYSRIKHGFKRSYGDYGSQDHWSTAAWWAMYHQAYRLRWGSLDAGWCVFAAGFKYSAYAEDGSWLGIGGGSSTDYGARPYADKTINLTNNTVIIVNGSDYIYS